MNRIPLSALDLDFNTVLEQQYLGIPTDTEEGMMVRRSFRMRRELDALVDRLVQDPATYYRGSQDFFHHAVLALVDAYIRAGYPDSQLAAERDYEASIRLQAHEAERLRVMQSSVHQFEDGIHMAVEDGDWETVAHYLTTFGSWIARSPTTGVSSRIKRALVMSDAVREAVVAYHRTGELGQLEEVQMKQANDWYGWMEEWS